MDGVAVILQMATREVGVYSFQCKSQRKDHPVQIELKGLHGADILKIEGAKYLKIELVSRVGKLCMSLLLRICMAFLSESLKTRNQDQSYNILMELAKMSLIFS